jgi:hypothetical protein
MDKIIIMTTPMHFGSGRQHIPRLTEVTEVQKIYMHANTLHPSSQTMHKVARIWHIW